MNSFINHPYWLNILAIPSHIKNDHPVKKAARLPRQQQEEFLTLIAAGFYPISYTSPLGFKRVAELTTNVQVKETAHFIFEVELGKHPFIKNNWNTGILHCDQFKITIASLVDDLDIKLPEAGNFQLNKILDINNSPISGALAVCDVIEHTAPAIINYVQDFVAQWQYLTGRPSSKINRTWLDEHSLTEGDGVEDQHVGMIEKMMTFYEDIINSREYDLAKENYNNACIEHLDDIYEKIMQVVEQPAEAFL